MGLLSIIRVLIFEYGMRKILETLIQECSSDEDYVVALKKDLQKALKNYEARYRIED